MELFTLLLPFQSAIKTIIFQFSNILTIRSGRKNKVKEIEITKGNDKIRIVYK